MLNDHGDATEVLSVRSRPVRNPIFLGLGTAAILAAGGASNAVLADETPTPSPSGSEGSTPSTSDTPTPSPTPSDTQTQSPEAVLTLDVGWTQSTKTVQAGTVVKGTVRVTAHGAAAADTHLTATASGGKIGPACATEAGGCKLPSIGAETTLDYTQLTVTISSSKTSGGTVPLTIKVKDGSASATASHSISVSPRPSASPSRTATHSTSSNGSGGSGGGSGGSGGSSGSSSSGGSSGSSSGGSSGSGSNGSTTSIPGSGAAYVPPSAAGQLLPANNGSQTAQFPQIAPQQNGTGAAPPAVVADQPAQNMGSVRGTSPEPQELTFQRLASTQAAWLAALLVAFSLLLTHIRLNKPAAARARKGVHRRQRTGVFQA